MLSRTITVIRIAHLVGLGTMMLMACGQTLSDSEYLLRADALKSKGDINAAIIETKNALQQNPKNGEARLLLSLLYNEQGDGAAAESNLIRAQELGVTTDKLVHQLARALFLQQQYQKIIDTISVPETLDSKARAEVLAIRAEARLMLGEPDAATPDIEQALNADANSSSALIAAARQHRLKGKDELALDFENKAQEIAPHDPEVWLYKGESAMARKRFADAQQAYNHALSLPGSTVSRVRNFVIQMGLASSLLAQNKDDEALPHINTLLASNPKHPIANYLRGLWAYKKNDYKAAIGFLEISVAQKSSTHNVFALLGASNFALGNFQQAEDFLSRHFAQRPQDDHVRKLLAATQIKLNKPEQAIKTLGDVKMASHDPQDTVTILGTAASMMNDPHTSRAVLRKAVKAVPDNPFLQVKLAESYFREGDYEQTLRELEKSTADRKSSLQNRMLMVLTHLRKRDHRAALDLTQKLVKEHPQEAVLYNLLGGVHLASKESKLARQEFQHSLELDKEFYPAMINLGQLDLAEGKPNHAIKWFQKVLGKNNNHAQALMGMAHAEAKQGRVSASIEWLEKARQADAGAVQPRLILARAALARGDTNGATELAQEIVNIDPDSVIGLLLSGETQMQLGNYSRAESYFSKAVKIQPKSANAQFQLGEAQNALSNTSQARDSYQEALKIEPNFLPAILALANLEVRTGNTDTAMQLADSIIKREPNASAGYVLRGDLMMTLKKYSTAAAAYNMAAQRKPSAVLAIKQYQALAGHKAPFDKRVEPLRSWLNAHPTDEAVLLAWADAHVTAKRSKEAVEIYQRILQTNPNHIIALNNLAIAYQASNDPRAVLMAEQAYRLDSKNPQLADTLGWILVQQNDPLRGKPFLEQSSHDLPNDPAVNYHLAVAKNKTGDIAGARELLTKILAQKASFDERSEAEALAKQLQ